MQLEAPLVILRSDNRRKYKLIDLSHVIEKDMVTYPGLPAPMICDFLSRESSRAHYSEGTEFQIGKIEMVGNTGTYIDSPFHRYPTGKDLSQLPLSCLANLESVLVRVECKPSQAIDVQAFKDFAVKDKAVLIQTGWSKHWRTDQYYKDNPFLTKNAAIFLKENGATLVGIDSLNIDSLQDKSRPVHTILLGAEIPIVEHMCNLELLPDAGFRFFAVSPKVKAFGTFPVRAFALID